MCQNLLPWKPQLRVWLTKLVQLAATLSNAEYEITIEELITSLVDPEVPEIT